MGMGWTYGPSAAADVVERQLAPLVVGADAANITQAWMAMVAAVASLHMMTSNWPASSGGGFPKVMTLSR